MLQLLLILNLLSFVMCLATNNKQTAADRLEAARKKAENLFTKSRAEDAKKLEEKNSSQKEVQQVQQEKKIEQIPVKQSTPTAILSQHKQFSDDWWKELFNCKDCPTNRKEKIDCNKLLEANPQWQEIGDMKDGFVKKMVTQKALTRYYNTLYSVDEERNTACGLACALCVGGDPNTRVDKVESHDHEPHTALHTLTFFKDKNYGLFVLLLEKGVDPEELCMPAHPDSYIPDEWKKEWSVYKNQGPKGEWEKNRVSKRNKKYLKKLKKNTRQYYEQ